MGAGRWVQLLQRVCACGAGWAHRLVATARAPSMELAGLSGLPCLHPCCSPPPRSTTAGYYRPPAACTMWSRMTTAPQQAQRGQRMMARCHRRRCHRPAFRPCRLTMAATSVRQANTQLWASAMASSSRRQQRRKTRKRSSQLAVPTCSRHSRRSSRRSRLCRPSLCLHGYGPTCRPHSGSTR